MDWTMETFWTVGKDFRRLRLIGRLPGLLGSQPFCFSTRDGRITSLDQPSSAQRAAPCITPGEAPRGRRNPGCDCNMELRPGGAIWTGRVASHRTNERHAWHPISMAPMLHDRITSDKSRRQVGQVRPGGPHHA